MNVSDIPERATQTVYGGIWKFLSRVVQVPETPPEHVAQLMARVRKAS